MEVPLIFSIICWNSLTSIAMPEAISSSEAAWPREDSSRRTVSSTSRAFWRTERGTQSMVRSSSKMAPRMRVTAYVLNFTCFPGVELVDGVEEPENPESHEVIELDVLRHSHCNLSRNVLYQRGVLPHEEITQLLVLASAGIVFQFSSSDFPSQRLSAISALSFFCIFQDRPNGPGQRRRILPAEGIPNRVPGLLAGLRPRRSQRCARWSFLGRGLEPIDIGERVDAARGSAHCARKLVSRFRVLHRVLLRMRAGGTDRLRELPRRWKLFSEPLRQAPRAPGHLPGT